jgi:hypothetical protein
MVVYKTKIQGLGDLNKVSKTLSSINKEQAKVNKGLKKQQQLTDTLTSSTTKKVEDIGNKFKKLSGSDVLSRPLNAFNKSFEYSRKSGDGFFKSFTKGFGGVGKSISRMGGLTKVIGVLFKSLMRTLVPLGLIMGAFVILKKLFTLNIGGMTTGFFKIVGEIKAAMGQLTAWINKSLKKLSPLFKLVFTPIIRSIRFVFAIIKGVFKIVGAILNPIFDILKELGDAFSGIFGDGGGQGKAFEQILKGVGKAFEIIGKVVGHIMKAVLLPLKIIFKILGFIIDKVITRTKKGFQTLFGWLKPIINFIQKIIDFFKKSADKQKERRQAIIDKAKEKYPVAARAAMGVLGGGKTENNTTNDNRNISVYTNKGIDRKSFDEDGAVNAMSN